MLEYWSNEARRVPGWVCKPLRCDYIAYAVVPRGCCYLLPVLALQSAWERYGAEWVAKHKKIQAINKGYTTVSVGVPTQTLFSAIGQALRVQFTPGQVAD